MSDQTAGGHVHRTPKAEFYIYFAMIFLVAVPLSLGAWVWAVIRHQRLPVHGPLARAWHEAGAITPAIFRP
ncbi:cytochrome PufQ [Pseudotabrizicola alkalilacus]|uniref:Protein pufQ n=1 Tax=Pseudotabrizicola alkalilacus TaxID=2305252 RepID=A0A411Z1N7_9RHOB|nr:cytochrome PufQ [Pseudotabrizicola alkalilacus]RGP36975.1 protein pufQ [Pseudotabrizicola alkalilacus]